MSALDVNHNPNPTYKPIELRSEAYTPSEMNYVKPTVSPPQVQELPPPPPTVTPVAAVPAIGAGAIVVALIVAAIIYFVLKKKK